MGCNCKRGGKPMNNLSSPDHIQIAKDVFSRIISQKTIEDLTDLDKVEIMGAFASLYVNASSTPSVENAINEIKVGIELYDVKYKRR